MKHFFNSKINFLLHGGDYNPDQWLHRPDILEDDIRLLKEANINCVSMGIFAWSTLEPTEGQFQFDWLENVIDKLYENGIYVILATPSGARPRWLSEKHPEVLRKNANRVRELHRFRHNHCYTSEVYRNKVKIINQELAKRFSHHPAIILWHISNEFGGYCYCEQCEGAFRNWLQEKYKTLDNLNHAWWTSFWSKTFTDWDQIRFPGGIGESSINGMNIDFKRFSTDQTIDFYKHEVRSIKEVGTDLPFTTNFMGIFEMLDYQKFAKELDVISWDSYPDWHNHDHIGAASFNSFLNVIQRSFKMKPFLLMESTPSTVNWRNVSKLKKPGMHILASIQAIAEGSDSVLYFQMRQSRGSHEKFHGAVISHDNSNKHRIFNEVKQLGAILKDLQPITGMGSPSEIGLLYDWDNRWAIKESRGPRNQDMGYVSLVTEWYNEFWKLGHQVDIIGKEHDLSKYKLLVVPMLYMCSEQYAKTLSDYVEQGGLLITTYFTGYVNDTDLCHLGGFPGPLRELLGIRIPEIDALFDHDSNHIEFEENEFHLTGTYECIQLCEIIELDTALSLANYTTDFYKNQPAITANNYGKGQAIHVGTRIPQPLISDIIQKTTNKLDVKTVLGVPLPHGVSTALRSDGETEYVFIMNFNDHNVSVQLEKETIELPAFNYKVMNR